MENRAIFQSGETTSEDKILLGNNPDAVKIQIYSAIIAYCLVAIIGNKLKVDRSIYAILQILSISLLDKTPLKELLTNQNYKDVKELNYIQLKIKDFLVGTNDPISILTNTKI